MKFIDFSDSYFKPIKDAIESETGKTLEDRTSIFKDALYKSLEDKLLESWGDACVDEALAKLEFSKEKSAGSSKQPRPSEKSVEEQSRQALMMSLLRKKAYLLRVVQAQNQAIAQQVVTVEEARRNLKDQEQKQDNVLGHIEADVLMMRDSAEITGSILEFTSDNVTKSFDDFIAQ